MTKVDVFLKELSELTVKHGLLIEGCCPVPPTLIKLKLENVPGRYRSARSKKDGETVFRWHPQ